MKKYLTIALLFLAGCVPLTTPETGPACLEGGVVYSGLVTGAECVTSFEFDVRYCEPVPLEMAMAPGAASFEISGPWWAMRFALAEDRPGCEIWESDYAVVAAVAEAGDLEQYVGAGIVEFVMLNDGRVRLSVDAAVSPVGGTYAVLTLEGYEGILDPR